jgi:serine/threonine-protein kinase SRPK3
MAAPHADLLSRHNPSRHQHVALKILTGNATRWNRESKLQELQVLQRLSFPPGFCSQHCIRLVDHFYQRGVDVNDGEHLCMATELMGASVASIRKTIPDQFIPVTVTKRILRHLLRGIAELHSRQIAHTG